MRTRLLILCVFAFCLAFPQEAFAKKHKHLHGIVVASVNEAAGKIVFTDEDNKQDLAYQVSLGATITVDRQPATLKQIHAGMLVVTYSEADEHVLSQLDVQSAKAK